MGELLRVGMEIAASPMRRAQGLAAVADERAVMLVPCRDIHTVGMSTPIDVAFVDGKGSVLESHRDVAPMRRLRCSKAVAVVERRSQPKEAWYRRGDRIALSRCDRAQGEC